MATREEIDIVIEITDMVDLVSPYVKLTKQGKSLKVYVHSIMKKRHPL